MALFFNLLWVFFLTARFFVDAPLHTGATLNLPVSVARHVQVLRLQPGQKIVLFNGQYGAPGVAQTPEQEGVFEATIESMGRQHVDVVIGNYSPTFLEYPIPLHLFTCMPANDRMDWLVEKATELGVASITPLMSERSVLRLQGERAEKKQAHWRGIAIAACEQSGRNRVPMVGSVCRLFDVLAGFTSELTSESNNEPAKAPANPPGWNLCLSLLPEQACPPHNLASCLGASPSYVNVLSGPEGGFTPEEEKALRASSLVPVNLGARVLRAETAPVAFVSWLTLALAGVSLPVAN